MNNISEFVFLSALSFLFGVTQKLADGHHEHGLNFFPGAGVVFGTLAGGLAFYLIGYSPVLQAAYLGPLLYWFFKQKIDCLPLIILAIMMLFGVFLSKGDFTFPLYGVLWVFAGYVVLDAIKQRIRSLLINWFFARRLHFHLIHFVYAFAVWDVYGYSSLFFGLLGTAFANRVFAIPEAAESEHKIQYGPVR